MATRPTQALVDFVVDLVVDSDFRRRFHDADLEGREAICRERGLDSEETTAVVEAIASDLVRLINTQVVTPDVGVSGKAR